MPLPLTSPSGGSDTRKIMIVIRQAQLDSFTRAEWQRFLDSIAAEVRAILALRNDPRVVVREGINARHLELADLGEQVDLAVCDVSFISATQMIPAMLRVFKPGSERLIVLVKPQFEVGKGMVGKGGIVRDPALHASSCAKVRNFLEEQGFTTDMIESPITGAEGNREFLVYGRR